MASGNSKLSRTVDRWREFAVTPKVLKFPYLELLGDDHAPPIVTGIGEICMETPERFTFTLSGTPADIGYALGEMNRRKSRPYDPLARLRLLGKDDRGIEWNGGWTSPTLSVAGDRWTFSGEIIAITTHEESSAVSARAGAELLFLLRVGDPLTLRLARYVYTGAAGEPAGREHEFGLLGSKIRFSYEASAGTLVVTATQSIDFCAPFAENWLSEPLRILFGQLVYPRLVVRNGGNGKAFISIRQVPGLVRGANWAALWEDENLRDTSGFWASYARILEFIATDRDKDGQRNFEADTLTRLYEECVLAARGSRWVWALTFASSIEGLANLLRRKDAPFDELAKPSMEETKEIENLRSHIEAWSGAAGLKRIATNAIRRSGEISTTRVLRRLVASGVASKEQFAAWQGIRHRVMHGDLISIYSTEEEDKQLLALAALMHSLTRYLLALGE
jgi:hypothetical protein